MTDLSPRQQLLEQISDKLCSALQSDLENGVSSLNAEAVKTFNRNYPALNDVIAWVHDLTWRKCLMSNPVPLSLAAQAVLDAAYNAYTPTTPPSTCRCVAAALRAAADLERQSPWYKRTGRFVNCSPAPAGAPGREGCGARWMRDQILAIADELEGAQ